MTGVPAPGPGRAVALCGSRLAGTPRPWRRGRAGESLCRAARAWSLQPGLRAPDTRCCCGKRKQKSIELSVVSAGPRPAPPPATTWPRAQGWRLEAGGCSASADGGAVFVVASSASAARVQHPSSDPLCARYIVPNTTSPTLSPPLICSKILETSSCLIMFLHCNASKICVISPSYGWSR